jgi:hypothetical protein
MRTWIVAALLLSGCTAAQIGLALTGHGGSASIPPDNRRAVPGMKHVDVDLPHDSKMTEADASGGVAVNVLTPACSASLRLEPAEIDYARDSRAHHADDSVKITLDGVVHGSRVTEWTFGERGRGFGSVMRLRDGFLMCQGETTSSDLDCVRDVCHRVHLEPGAR